MSIHDVGAGGLSNALAELVFDSQLGAQIDFNQIAIDEPSMSPMEVWCNESQERFVLTIAKESLPLLETMCERERAAFAVVGELSTPTESGCQLQLFRNVSLPSTTLTSTQSNKPTREVDYVVDVSLDAFLSKTPPLFLRDNSVNGECDQRSTTKTMSESIVADCHLTKLLQDVLRHPTVGDKAFLISIGDRSVGGLVHRDQLVGPWQVTCADCAITARDYDGVAGEAMAIGERTPVAIGNAAAASRLAVAEAITNILAAPIDDLSSISLSCNWMAAASEPSMGADLYHAVEAITQGFCQTLGIAIPVGKDSLSMKTQWHRDDDHSNEPSSPSRPPSSHDSSNKKNYQVKAPVSLIVSAFANLSQFSASLTPQLAAVDSQLWFIDLGQQRLLGSIVQHLQGWDASCCCAPDIHAEDLQNLSSCIINARQQNLLLSYHDRSDGGVWTTLCEMSFASRLGLTIHLPEQAKTDPLAYLLNEEIGVVVQVAKEHELAWKALLAEYELTPQSHVIATVHLHHQQVRLDELNIDYSRQELQWCWNETSFHLQSLRDNPECAKQQRQTILNDDAKLSPKITANAQQRWQQLDTIHINATKPKVAILREQGVNGYREMAYAFHRVGFDCVDVHMSDLLAGSKILRQVQGMVACGGFSYGDVLGAGQGWAKSILFNDQVKREFKQFFQRNTTFTLGVCNGCQMMSHLQEIIPDACFPRLTSNRSAQFEARLVQLSIEECRSVLLQDLAGCVLPIAIAHGEGQFVLNKEDYQLLKLNGHIAASYVDAHHQPSQMYPINPNGSLNGLAALTGQQGRVTIMMPHPERSFLNRQLSWHPTTWQDTGKSSLSPWSVMFDNARRFVA